MKYKIVIIFLLSIGLVSAFSIDDFFDFSGNIVDNKLPSVTLSRPIDTQVVNNPLVLKWRYFDPEDDEMDHFVLQIDDDPRFLSPESFFGVGESYEIILDKDGLYYWRVLVANDFGEKLSESWSFYLNVEMKVCEDGTPFFECSKSRPNYCGSGVLNEDCQRCGCFDSGVCQLDGSCLELKCTDNTIYGDCSTRKPFLCLNGNLREVCNVCGCDEGKVCMNDGSCSEVIIEEEPEIIFPEPEETGPSVFERIIQFFVSLFYL